MVNAAGQTSLSELQRRQALAQALSQQQIDTSNPLAAGIGALAKVLATRKANNLAGETAAFEQEQRGKDLSALSQVFQGGGDLSMIADPRIQELAATFIGRQQQSEADFARDKTLQGERIAADREMFNARNQREDRIRSEDREAAVADREDEQAFKREMAQIQAEAEAAQRAAEPNLSTGEKEVDKAFAKEFNDFVSTGGFADVQKNLQQLREAREVLVNTAGDVIGSTGAEVAFLPKFLRDISLSSDVREGAAAQDTIEEVVQRNLRLILGAQFTEREGQRLIERAFNPRQSEEENIKRLDRLMDQIETAAVQKAQAAQYFRENGTLKGFTGKTEFTMEDFGIGEEDDIQSLIDQYAD